MLQYFVNKLFGDLPSNFSFVIGKKLSYERKTGYFEIYDGVSKNNEDVCIFIYEKKSKEENSSIRRYTSNHFKYCKKLIHPNILKVLYTHESDKRIYIVTEKCIPLICQRIKSDPIWGLYEIISAVHFINMCNYIHCLIGPYSVFVNSRGRWKLSLFDCVHESNENIHNILNDVRYHLFYNSECSSNSMNHIHSSELDSYGLGFLMTWSYKNYISLTTVCSNYPISVEDGKYCNRSTMNGSDSFVPGISTWGNGFYSNTVSAILSVDNNNRLSNGDKNTSNGDEYIPRSLYGVYNMLKKGICAGYSMRSNNRVDLSVILNDDCLKKNTIVSTMLFLTELHMKSKNEKTKFLDDLLTNLDNIPTDVKVQMILPELVQNIEISENCVKCLKIILIISKDMTRENFEKLVYPNFCKYFSLTDRNVRYVLLECFHMVENHLNSNNMNEICTAYLYGFLDNNISIKNETIKNFIYVFPKLKKGFKSSSLNALLENLKQNDCCIKTNTIICIAKIAKYILADKQNILENVYLVGLHDPFIQTRVATIQSIKFTYDQFSTKKFVSNILPMLIKLLIDDAMEIRICAFEALDYIIVQLKNHLLLEGNGGTNNKGTTSHDYTTIHNDTTSNSDIATGSMKTYKFMDKIKDIIQNKDKLNADPDGLAVQGECFNMIGLAENDMENNKYRAFLNSTVDELSLGKKVDKSLLNCSIGNSLLNSTIDKALLNSSIDNAFLSNSMNNPHLNNCGKMYNNVYNSSRSNDKMGNSKKENTNHDDSSVHLSVDNYRGNQSTFIFSNKEMALYNKQENNFTFEEKNIRNNYSDRDMNIWDGKNEFDNEHKEHYNDNNYNVEIMNTSDHKGNGGVNSFKGNFEKRSTDKKKKKKIDLDIDDFFDEFDLKKESSSSRVKLSLL
ncbi:protein kinase, putative [Plasmodium malariae]|uniref:Protein kinase, putative n=1 Tax=Plasmodium malariae TaxID=5858 RepID=A0A1C3KB84_PLAMA|nr:protein kinase, putative [Plasmodium malariae]